MNVTQNLLAAAISGALLGVTGCAASTPASETPSAMSEPMSGSPAMEGAKHACKGQNACKGQGFTPAKDGAECAAKGGKVVP